MIKTCDLIKDVEEKYIPMLEMVNLPDFYKCIAQFSGLSINSVDDKVIKKYLLLWAEGKYRFFERLGNKLQLDIPFEYNNLRDDLEQELIDLGKEFPGFGLWLIGFRNCVENKIKDMSNFKYSFESDLKMFGLTSDLSGTTITHFFKSKLNAPDDLVTKIGRIFENDKVKANYTISIDPVDMMLASENPYNWQSCYRLETPNSESHADGCLAAVIDDASAIAYVWTNEGKFDLYDNFKFKSIRYKKMRQWLAVSQDFNVIHFNSIYPGKMSYTNEFYKQLRELAENILNPNQIWVKDDDCDVQRYNMYGYSEYDCDYCWKVKDTERQCFYVFNKEIECPCGCGQRLIGSYECEDEEEYNGDGFIAENFYESERYYCPYTDEECDCADCCDEYNCGDCSIWRDNHPVCEIEDEDGFRPDCHDFEDNDVDVDDGVAIACKENCSQCPHWKEHHKAWEKIVAKREKERIKMLKEREALWERINNSIG